MFQQTFVTFSYLHYNVTKYGIKIDKDRKGLEGTLKWASFSKLDIILHNFKRIWIFKVTKQIITLYQKML